MRRGYCTKTKQEWPDSGSTLENIFCNCLQNVFLAGFVCIAKSLVLMVLTFCWLQFCFRFRFNRQNMLCIMIVFAFTGFRETRAEGEEVTTVSAEEHHFMFVALCYLNPFRPTFLLLRPLDIGLPSLCLVEVCFGGAGARFGTCHMPDLGSLAPILLLFFHAIHDFHCMIAAGCVAMFPVMRPGSP